jgi:hypothetical protein
MKNKDIRVKIELASPEKAFCKHTENSLQSKIETAFELEMFT